jgi:hypothetical protein
VCRLVECGGEDVVVEDVVVVGGGGGGGGAAAADADADADEEVFTGARDEEMVRLWPICPLCKLCPAAVGSAMKPAVVIVAIFAEAAGAGAGVGPGTGGGGGGGGGGGKQFCVFCSDPKMSQSHLLADDSQRFPRSHAPVKQNPGGPR